MALPSSGPLSLNDIQTEFGGTNPISISEYYAGGAFVPAGTSGTNGAVPSSGAISIRNFYGTTAFVPFGEAVYTTPGTYSYVVPAGITEISAVAVGGGGVQGWNGVSNATSACVGGAALSYSNGIPVTPGETLTVVAGTKGDKVGATPAVIANPSSISRGGTVLLRADSSNAINSPSFAGTKRGLASNGVGAVRYSGGTGRTDTGSFGSNKAAGGAAGYAGDGGNGGTFSNTNVPRTNGGNGVGGGGGGGGGCTNNANAMGAGGGVGVYGQGADGVGGITPTSINAAGARGNSGSGGINVASSIRDAGSYGGGAGTDPDSIVNQNIQGSGGAVRIIWGTGKSYPNNAN